MEAKEVYERLRRIKNNLSMCKHRVEMAEDPRDPFYVIRGMATCVTSAMRDLTDLMHEVFPPKRQKGLADGFEPDQDKKYIVRFYDSFDRKWLDISEPVSYEEAEKLWQSYTDCGRIHASADEIDYFAVYPEDIVMFFRYHS